MYNIGKPGIELGHHRIMQQNPQPTRQQHIPYGVCSQSLSLSPVEHTFVGNHRTPLHSPHRQYVCLHVYILHIQLLLLPTRTAKHLITINFIREYLRPLPVDTFVQLDTYKIYPDPTSPAKRQALPILDLEPSGFHCDCQSIHPSSLQRLYLYYNYYYYLILIKHYRLLLCSPQQAASLFLTHFYSQSI